METATVPGKSAPDAIPAHLTLRDASGRIGINRHYLKGYAQASGIRLVPIGRSLVMTRRDFERLRKLIAKGEATAAP